MAEPADAPAPDLTGRTVGDFQVLRKLGQGGMGQVYLARQLSLKREVALKILRRDLADDASALKRFQAEAEAVARVTHANIVQVYAVGEYDGLRYMALEYVAGRNLRDYLARKGPPDLPLALAILKQVAAALQRAGEVGLVHRDIKPENILVTKKAEVKVADFGLSRYFAAADQPLNLTQTGMTLGTPLYMSPEQVQGQPIDQRSDLYSFGVTAYHLLAGHPPFRGATAFEVAVQHVQAQPAPLADARPDLPPDLCAIVHKLMAKHADDRYQSARDVIRDLAKVQKGLAVGLPAVTGTTIPALPASSVSASSPTVAYAPVPTESAAGPRALRAVGATVVVAVAVAGWWAFAKLNPPAEAKGPPPVVGLPDPRSPDPVVSARERELRATLDSRAAKPEDVFDAAIGLGLLLVRERRLDEADDVFKKLEQEQFPRLGAFKGPRTPTGIVGQLGQAVVLAQRDKAKDSNDKFAQALAGGGPKAAPGMAVQSLLLAHPELGQAVSEAVNRNAENLKPARLPPSLEWLRTPHGLARGPTR
jgi:serine/threonine-protein kinase